MLPHPVQQPPLPQPALLDHQQLYGLYNSVPNSPNPFAPRILSQNGPALQQYRAVPQIPQQHPNQLHRTNSYPIHGSTEDATRHPRASEHMLRRKTPNGTLAAGYDGTPVEWASKPHVAKHILIPLSNASNHQSPDFTPGGVRIDPNANVYFKPLASSSSLRYPSQSDQSGIGVGAGGISNPGVEGVSMNWMPQTQYSPGIDSVLNQVQQAPTYFFPVGLQAPPAVQPPYQSCLGPTASNDEAPYGPYWPDGGFIPYRPAAFRDPGYYSAYGTPAWAGLPGPSVGSHKPAFGQASGMLSRPNVGADGTPFFAPLASIQTPFSNHSNGTPKEYPFPNISHTNPSLIQAVNRNSLCTPQGHYTTALAPPQSQLLPGQQGPLRDSQYQNGSPSQSLPFSPYVQRSASDIELQSTNVQFKEKVLSWAHRVYVDLLASLHHLRRNSQQSQGHSRQKSQRPGIFPKPPRQPGWSVSVYSGDRSDLRKCSQSQQPSHSEGLEGYSNKRLKQQLDVDTSSAGVMQNSPGAQFYSNGIKFNAPDYESRTSQQHVQQPPANIGAGTLIALPDRTHPVRRGSSASTAPLYPQQGTSPATNAVAALEMLTNLCRESNWKWVDGMLLAGCLAYGLGEYNTAMVWYLKIIEVDLSHVEAMSNLAATLLALNRRDEAETYWYRSVKLRPSYFEAVEHLIGLLCGNQRGAEAVKIIDFVEQSLRLPKNDSSSKATDIGSETSSGTSRSSSVSTTTSIDKANFDYEGDDSESTIKDLRESNNHRQAGFGTSGYAIPDSENGRMLALLHAKGNMLYALGDNAGASQAFEDAVLVGAGRRVQGIQGLIKRILNVVAKDTGTEVPKSQRSKPSNEPILLPPDRALQTSKLLFPSHGELPGLKDVPSGMARKAAISTTSNSLLSLAKIFQDGMSSGSNLAGGRRTTSGVRDILALYYLSLALQPSPSTANNVGILLASVQQTTSSRAGVPSSGHQLPHIPGVVPGSGIALALEYYNYGLNLDPKHAHLYTNLGSLLKDIGQLTAAIKMYGFAVNCDGNFDIALANLANAVKDQGKISEAIGYYRRAVAANPDFAEAVCGLANALNSVCSWPGRGGIAEDGCKRDRWHIDEAGMLLDARSSRAVSSGWMKRVVDIVKKQLAEGEHWGKGVLYGDTIQVMLRQLQLADSAKWPRDKWERMENALRGWAWQNWEGAKVVRLVERANKKLMWRWYQDEHIGKNIYPLSTYARPQLPSALSIPSAPTVLPFHTFTCPLSAKQVRMISQRNGLRISCSTLRAPWLPSTVYRPPAPPNPHLNVGYVSSDFNNHPLAHLMQSVFGLHNPTRVKAFCYATTASDGSVHRSQIEREAPVFYDASHWSAEKLVNQIVQDGIHILINLNGYTRGARNEVFAARPCPIQMSFMGFAGTLGAEWCDYLLADTTAVPLETLRPWRRNIDLEDQLCDNNHGGNEEDWVYSENIVFSRDTFFCCDHRQSAPDSQEKQLSWEEEQNRRWAMRKELFPQLPDDAIILANFNQLYKIEPTTFRTWLRILNHIPKAILWLLRFPDLGQSNLKQTAELWAGSEVAKRIYFTDVAPKHQHISRARVCDLFLDTPECNAHTTAADVLWSGTPLLTLPRYRYKMCSRMAASILRGALPKTAEGSRAAEDLIASSEEEYEERAIRLGNGLCYSTDPGQQGKGKGRLVELRKMLFESRWSSALFDTRRWVSDLEVAYGEAWRKWVAGEGGDIWL
ncbi:hypothetical protein FGG08_004660 [Glutinoglossum americanum]|uniref:protein O-GlcNAc transferase n=1 Tax=Glutinoglossum americanum TaxID=1670608 RepID=A0A9P8L2I0_9PEZI|nr:hypothetical protein FGG08_004660 [Glutinoglossum americanum]